MHTQRSLGRLSVLGLVLIFAFLFVLGSGGIVLAEPGVTKSIFYIKDYNIGTYNNEEWLCPYTTTKGTKDAPYTGLTQYVMTPNDNFLGPSVYSIKHINTTGTYYFYPPNQTLGPAGDWNLGYGNLSELIPGEFYTWNFVNYTQVGCKYQLSMTTPYFGKPFTAEDGNSSMELNCTKFTWGEDLCDFPGDPYDHPELANIAYPSCFYPDVDLCSLGMDYTYLGTAMGGNHILAWLKNYSHTNSSEWNYVPYEWFCNDVTNTEYGAFISPGWQDWCDGVDNEGHACPRELNNLTRGETYYFCNLNDTIQRVNFNLGGTASIPDWATLKVKVISDEATSGAPKYIFNAIVQVTDTDTNQTRSGATGPNGTILAGTVNFDYPLGETKTLKIEVSAPGFSMKAPYTQSCLMFYGANKELIVSMHRLDSEPANTGQLDVSVVSYQLASGSVQDSNGDGIADTAASLGWVENAKVIIVDNVTNVEQIKYTGLNGQVTFYLTKAKWYRIRVNYSGFTQYTPSYNEIFYFNENSTLVEVWLWENSVMTGSKEAYIENQEAAEAASQSLSSVESYGSAIFSGLGEATKNMIWLLITSFSSIGAAVRGKWQLGAIVGIIMMLAGGVIGWVYPWIAIVIIVISGFIVAKSVSEAV